MDIKQMKEQHNKLLDRIDDYHKTCIAERRNLSSKEKNEIVELEMRAYDLKEAIEKARAEARSGAKVITEGETRTITQEKRGIETMTKEVEMRSIAQELLKGEKMECRATTTDTHGNVIPTLLYDHITRKMFEQSNVVNDIPKITGLGRIDFMVEKNVDKAKMLGEVEELTETENAGYDKVTLDSKRMGTLCKISRRMLDLNPNVGIEELTNLVARRMALKLEEQIFSGDGTGNNFTGGILKIYEKGQPGALETANVGALEIADIKDLVLDLNPTMLNGAKFYMNREMFKLVGNLQNNIGEFFLTHDVIKDKPVYLLFGLQVEITEEVPAKTMVLGNIKAGMKLRMNEGIEITVLTEQYKTSGLVGVMAELFADASVIDKQAFRVLRIKE